MKRDAWAGDWRARIAERIAERGAASVSDFAARSPTSTFLELARALGVERDVAAVQIEELMKEEAVRAGTIERFARDALARSVRERYPEGWATGVDPGSLFGPTFAHWSAILDDEHEDSTWKVWQHLERNAPRGWLPAGADDLVILAAFKGVSFEPNPVGNPHAGDPFGSKK